MHNKSSLRQDSIEGVEQQDQAQPSVSIVVPLRIYSSHDRDFPRLQRLLTTVPTELEIVVADDSPNDKIRQIVNELVKARNNSVHVDCFAKHGTTFSIGRLRDAGVEAASASMILLHDVDFITSKNAYRRITSGTLLSQLLRSGDSAFCCIPVLFTSPIGWLLRTLLQFMLKFSMGRKYLMMPIGLWAGRLVLGSSAILTNRKHYIDVGGHSSLFEGHGGEDFELLNRLTALYPIGERPKDYPHDCGTLGFESSGFREYFSRYGRQAAEQNIFLLHQWHPRRNQDTNYINSRQKNFQSLYSQLIKDHTGYSKSRHAGLNGIEKI